MPLTTGYKDRMTKNANLRCVRVGGGAQLHSRLYINRGENVSYKWQYYINIPTALDVLFTSFLLWSRAVSAISLFYSHWYNIFYGKMQLFSVSCYHVIGINLSYIAGRV